MASVHKRQWSFSPTMVGCVIAPCPQGAHPQVAGLSLISISCKFLLFSVRVRAPKLERTNSPKRILGFITRWHMQGCYPDLHTRQAPDASRKRRE